MKLDDDDRARVPFALIGVLLLVSAGTIATTATDIGVVDRDAPLAEDRAIAAAETAVRDAAQTAGTEAAAAPVVEPADSPMGDTLDPDRPYRSYLELLVHLRAAERLDGIEEVVGSATAEATLPPIDDEQTAADAIDRATAEAVGNGSIRIRIENVSVTVVDGGRTVTDERRAVEVTIASPAVTLHDRTTEFEDALNRGPVARSGLGREVTGRLYAIGWARGHAQYWGAPIEEVIAHRHVELATASGVLDVQRETFGTADRASEQGLARATANVAAEDLLPSDWAGLAAAGLPDPNAEPDATAELSSPDVRTSTVEVGQTADRSFEALLDGDGPSFESVLEDAYALEGRIAVDTRRQSATLADADETPGSGWRVDRTRERLRVDSVRDGAASPPAARSDWETVETFERVVDVERTITRVWTDGENRTTTRTRYDEVHAVGFSVWAREPGLHGIPDRNVRDLRSPADPPRGTGGPDGWEETVAQLVDDRGGADAIAERAVHDEVDRGSERVRIDIPDGVRAWAYDDLAELREEIRDVSVETNDADLAVGANPSRELADELRDRSEEFLDPPTTYENRADRARVAARGAYLDLTADHLDTDASDVAAVQGSLSDELERLSAVPQAEVDEILAAGVDHVRPEPQPIVSDPPGGDIDPIIDAEPAHPTRHGVETVGPRGNVTGEKPYYPLSVRTANVASLPTDAIADAVVDRLFADADRVSLPVAARALRDADRVPASTAPEGFETQRAELRSEVQEGVDAVADEAVDALHGPTALPRAERARAVRAGLDRWDDPAATALAIENGTAADAIAEEVALRTTEGDSDRIRDRSATRLRVAMGEAMAEKSATIPDGPVTDVLDGARDATREVARDAAEHGVETAHGRIDDRLNGGVSMVPAGVPIVPKPGLWWATVNAWTVEVEGSYAAFSVRTNAGTPETGGHVTYVRDGDPVHLDITGDGTPERLGTASRIEFETWTTVVVAVPPGRTGVGNVDGEPLQCSEGWSDECVPGVPGRS